MSVTRTLVSCEYIIEEHLTGKLHVDCLQKRLRVHVYTYSIKYVSEIIIINQYFDMKKI